jgi:hypothetical protein
VSKQGCNVEVTKRLQGGGQEWRHITPGMRSATCR